MSIIVRRMKAEDVPAGMRLKTEAGWNQTAGDWNRFLHLEPHGCFVAVSDGATIGTVTTCCFRQIAWIGMMLVATDHRGKGVGKKLFTTALDWLSEQKVKSIRLDATPLGKPLYQRFGFQTQFELTRMGGQLTPTLPALSPTSFTVDPIRPSDLAEISAMDQTVCHTERMPMLKDLIRVDFGGNVTRESGHLRAFTLCREGARAVQMGPCIAISPPAAEFSLQQVAMQLLGRAVFIDTPIDSCAYRLMQSCGLTPTRTLTRMCRGEAVLEDVSSMWASSGPEMG